ncbi:MAG: carbon-nitrogen hydrolase family protein [Candidatus Aenigmatarchaeota archaeon]
MKVRVAVAQMKIERDILKNLKKVEKFLREAKKFKADIIVFPEYFLEPTLSKSLRFRVAGLIKDVQQLAKKYSIFIVGSNPEFEKGKWYNTAYLISNKGKIIGKHRKIFLMPKELELGFSRGIKIRVFKTRFGKVAIPVCWDAFNPYSPELMRKFKIMGADFVFIPSYSLKFKESSPINVKNWLYSHCTWNDFYIVLSSNVGKPIPIKSFGHSLIICPERGILKEGSENKEELLIEDLDTKILRRAEKFDRQFVNAYVEAAKEMKMIK